MCLPKTKQAPVVDPIVPEQEEELLAPEKADKETKKLKKKKTGSSALKLKRDQSLGGSLSSGSGLTLR